MDNFFKLAIYNRIIAIGTACAFILSTIPMTPLHATAPNVDF